MNIFKNKKYEFEGGFNVRRFLIILSVFLLVSYGLFNARNLIIGPTIEIFSPTKDIETKDNTINVKGRAKNITFISLNERPIFVDVDGLFEEKLLLSPGSNIIEIKARDRFKKETEKIINIYYKQSAAISTTTNES
ncbi:hypothetical protein A2862_01745 [Candidatus Roizmanbacteria bacterium RIFCSPHIGHO2_01_FULL_38_41]|uniref:Uncharacterized protein n=1 Tax=Candidatus Zambryskibacteria bacterium RIFCSPLOWO2_12_FULL_39_16 TaxID=1802775 RepID=A0A1G2US68_9BACT|nr:MAG: hypothetical protein A2862_01745 [Candidatus Roizmanbacteria bacterium RIFCSPHIGHO2_01_FULL_38_41]OHA94554.1 MAG: hypothetical protein A3D37_01170 [Candidatus Zambryskibacteria bacterium RIFCSPHIGHO2_02_FULL_38_22]OHA97456.1 MAG: hypothetical protein A3E02_00260 [Candidatus Zambryskibacteria bacterium RIFCSPHIGHO2_12_FULL_38_34]OHB09010.1 MAG: hypothetical protein A3I19_02255 [Candidatus Zambryskibacteria bacterium RIFCSPLOWO2_02_FULL_38_13]OHB12255.1 MAG: hypothetical protein A3G46_013